MVKTNLVFKSIMVINENSISFMPVRQYHCILCILMHLLLKPDVRLDNVKNLRNEFNFWRIMESSILWVSCKVKLHVNFAKDRFMLISISDLIVLIIKYLKFTKIRRNDYLFR